MSEAISVRFRSGYKNYDFDPGNLKIQLGQDVIVRTAQGIEFGTCTRGNHEVSGELRPLSPVLRIATAADHRTVEYQRRREKDAFGICQQKIAEHGLEMKLVDVSTSFEGNKIVFYFTADGRVDFRALVRDLASVFRSRIELRQIGVRDEARMIGGLGICGRVFCCTQFLDAFLPVSIKMAKTQNLSLNPTKISGACGRLMCCLKYEQNAYEDAAKRLPRADSFVQTPDGPGTVRGVDLLQETLKVNLDSEPEQLKSYHISETILLRSGKGSREGIQIPERPARRVREKREEPGFEPIFSDFSYEDAPEPPAPQEIASVPEDAEPFAEDPERHRNRNNVRRAKPRDPRAKTAAPPPAPQKQKRNFYEGADGKRPRRPPWYRSGGRRKKGGEWNAR